MIRKLKNIKALKISVASPDQILSWSHGEVKKPETINYRTHRAEVDGLMDERIFGPTKNYECYCGKYKKIRYKGIVCDQCGVEVTNKRVRRERIGHIKLANPVTHVWYAYGIPNKLALILSIPQKKLETVIYYARYIVTDFSEDGKLEALKIIDERYKTAEDNLLEEQKTELDQMKEEHKQNKALVKKDVKDKDKIALSLENLENKYTKEIAKVKSLYKQKKEALADKFDKLRELVSQMQDGVTISEDQYKQLSEYGIDFFDLGMGAEAIRKLLKKINLEDTIVSIRKEIEETKSKLKKRKLIQRLRIFIGMYNSGIDPSWIVMDVVPVLPPDLRPIIQLPGGRFATSDLNDLYRRVINRNNRLKRLIRLGAPEIILRNEKRMLQEAVDALIDNSHRPGNAVLNSRDQAYKSLSDMLRGKQGRFRQNLLGKRVDYSARSVIITGPTLSIYQCGVPKTMALELFKPFVLSEIIKDGLAPNIKSAKLYFESQTPEVWDILERVTKNHPVLLNRAPTLHKQGIQAFFPVLIEGNAIQIHPLVCKGFNADFDGDQMAIHVPLTQKAKEEAISRMMVDSNILLMADGSPVVSAAKDMAAGIYYLTAEKPDQKKVLKIYGDVNEVLGFHDLGQLDLHEKVNVLISGKIRQTTPGRIIFNQLLPEEFEYLDQQIDKKAISKLSARLLEEYGSEVVVGFLDGIKKLGFKYATLSGLSISFSDFVVSEKKEAILEEVSKKENQYIEDYYMGLLTYEERKRLVEEAWMEAIDKITVVTWEKYNEKENDLVFFDKSGAVPVANPLRNISGIKGLILDPQGRIVELPIRSNYKQGLTSLEYFVAARGTRKGLADTALKTAESGYLTRRLVDVAQDLITREDDCGTENGMWMYRKSDRRMSFAERIRGRFLQEDVVDTKTGEIIFKKGMILNQVDAEKVEKMESIDKVFIRSPLTCQTSRGVCTKCYGFNLGTGKIVSKGIAVGIIAAQAMGEAATQLTLDTKHLSGRAGTDITQGLPRVEELFEARTPKVKAILAGIEGEVSFVQDEVSDTYQIVVSNSTNKVKSYDIETGDVAKVKRAKSVKQGDTVLIKKDGTEIKVPCEGRVSVVENKLLFEAVIEEKQDYDIAKDTILLVKEGDIVNKGQKLTEGSVDPKELLDYLGIHEAQQYIIDEIQKTYGVQGIGIDDKHVELIVKQMSRFVKVKDSTEDDILPGSYVDKTILDKKNGEMENDGKKTIKFNQELLGITTAAVKTESFLSAASFQEQVRVLTDAALIGKVDELRGLKENVIIGKPVPLGDELKD